MIVTCPSCTTRYFADEAAIGAAGRNVRCASCGHSWFVQSQLVLDQAAPEDLLPASAVAPRAPLTRDDVERMRRKGGAAATARIRERQIDRTRADRVRAAALAWGGAGAAFAATLGGAAALREDLVLLWPEAASAFAAAGMPVNAYGLEFANLMIERSYDGPTPVLVVTGEVRNVAGEARAAPPLRFALRDGQSNEIYRWIMRLNEQQIPAGASMPFETVIDNPPVQAEDLEATFASMREALEGGAAAMPPSQSAISAPRGFTDEPLGEAAHDGFEPEGLAEPEGQDFSAGEAAHGGGPLRVGSGRAGPIEGLAPRIEESAYQAAMLSGAA